MKIFGSNIDMENLKYKLLNNWTLFTNRFGRKGVIISLVSTVLVLGGLVTGVVFIKERQGVSVHASGVDLKLAAGVTSVNKGDEIQVDVYIDTKGLSVTGSDIRVKYDPNLLMAESIQQNTFLPVVLVPGKISTGTARIVLGSSPTEPKNGTGILASLKFKVLGSGIKTTVSFDATTAISALEQATNVLGTSTPLEINVTSGIGGTPIATPTLTATPAVTRGITSIAVTGNSVTVGFVNNTTNMDWIGIFPPGVDNTKYIDWRWLNNQQGGVPTSEPSSGSLTFTNIPPGTYEVRYVFRGTGVAGQTTPGQTIQISPTPTPTPVSSTAPRVTALSWAPTKCISWNTKGNCNGYAPAIFIVKGNNFITGSPKIRIYQHASTTLIYDGPVTNGVLQNVNTSTGYGELKFTANTMPWSFGSYNPALLTPSDITVYYP